jgi:signal transduction histidine kinase
MEKLLEYLPRGNMLSDREWARRHRFLQWILLAHPLGMYLLAVPLGRGVVPSALALAPALGCLGLSLLIRGRRPSSFFVTAGLVYSSAALVWVTNGSIEAHFHFFVIIGFIALYQDWVPFLWNIVFTVLSHGLGSWFQRDLMFNHPAAQNDPWLWSAIHGVAVLAACAGMVIFWRVSEDEQNARQELARRLTDAEIGRRRFTSELLVNLARRNQTMLYRQLDIINQLEEKEQDPDALAELFRLDHLATRVRRNAESLLVLSGEEPYRVWSAPVPLHDVVRAAIAETEHLDRVEMAVDRVPAVVGPAVTDLTHLLAELTENAVRFSPPDANVDLRTRRHVTAAGAQLLTIEDYGVGMPAEDLAAANRLLADAPEVDLSVSRRLGFHVVARLAARHGVTVTLSPTPGAGVTAAVLIPAELFAGTATVPRPRPAEPVPDRAAAPALPVRPARAERTARPAVAHQAATRSPVTHAAVTHTAVTDAGVTDDGPLWSAEVAERIAMTQPLPAVRGDGPRHGMQDHGADPAEPTTGFDGRTADGRWPGWWEPPVTTAPPDLPDDNGFTDGFTHVTGFTGVTDLADEVTEDHTDDEGIHGNGGTVGGDHDGRDDDAAGGAGGPRLTRRVPQTHLAPELRLAPDAPTDRPAHVPSRAPDALSRYQASRRAAQAEGHGDGYGLNGSSVEWSAGQR